ncbi:MAG: hypothetical protein H8E51_04870 [Bacteroidetes bacterium]|nr:hypothetical protein [Bacteroidota bacterium]
MKRARNKITIKAILIIAAVFGIQISTLVANNVVDKEIPTRSNSLSSPKCQVLIPEIPMEATFGEIVDFESPMNLNPVVPIEASFCDDFSLPTQNDSRFAPEVPSTADFDDKL